MMITVTVTVTFPAMAQVQVCESESRTRAAAELSMHSTCSEEVDWNTSLSPGRGSVTSRAAQATVAAGYAGPVS